MSKLDELRRSAVSNIDESMGGGRPARRPIPGVSAGGPRAIPSKLQGVIRSGNAAEIPVEKIGPDDDQPREEFDEAAIDRLAESLKGRGTDPADPSSLERGTGPVRYHLRGTSLESGYESRLGYVVVRHLRWTDPAL